ncbi:MAG: EamA family transporter [Candidatus Colwellbacteria bacterium]|nr:EamA family transporter [Candidatus Colwellbacteria bacterium]MBI3273896.1 EamA family transporter [Candidatus Colwellbacteria bacterium]
MTWFILTLAGSIAAGVANILDKLLLRKENLSDPWTYAFWSGIFGLFAVLLFPFGVVPATFGVIFIAFLAGFLFLIGVFFFFRALKLGQASIALPIVGGLTPVVTYLLGILFLGNDLGLGDLIGFVLIVGSGILFFGIERREVRLQSAMPALVSALFFGISNVLKKVAFDHTSFLTGFVWISLGTGALAVCSLVLPSVRRRILLALYKSEVSNKVLYLNNRVLALAGTVFINGAISLGHPALVEATQSFKLIVIFFGGWFILHEEFSGKVGIRKLIAVFLMIFGLGWLGLVTYTKSIPVDQNRPVTWGVTFSDKYSRALGLDWQNNFDAIVTDLRPKKMRLIAYWDEIEKERGKLDFSDLDWQLSRARENGISVILVLGLRTPRWPECHVPSWAEGLTTENREHALREYIPRIIERYYNDSEILAWQVENEPFLQFGLCEKRGTDFLEKEVALVRSLDSSRPIVVTDGGEFGLWYQAIKAGDVFGTTMYRRVYPPSIGKYVGIIDYPLSPSFFRLKDKLLRFLTDEPTKPFIVIELQAEPWGAVEVPLLSYDEQIRIFSPDYFRDTIDYAKAAGFDEYYLWGAEWWYLIKEKHDNPEIWEEAKNVFQSGV